MRPRLARFGAFEVDRDSGEIRRNGLRLRLNGKPVELLLLLIDRAGEVVSREDIRKHLWSDGTFVDFEHGLNAAMTRLRHALGDSARAPRFIETVPRRGYRWIAPLRSDEPAARSQFPVRWIAAVIVLIIISIGFPSGHGPQRPAKTAHDARALAVRAAELNRAGLKTIASAPLHRQAYVAAETALQLDPGMAEAYVARATARLRLDWDWQAAENDLRRAIELNPRFARARQTYAYLLAGRGRIEEANAQIDIARRLEPDSQEVRRDAGVILYVSRRYAAAIETLAPLLVMNPSDADATRVLADAFFHAGDEQRAAAHYTRWLELVGVPAAEVQRVRGTLAGEGFRGLWQSLSTKPPRAGHGYKIAAMLAPLGRTDAALAALDRAFADQESQLLFLRVDPYLDSLRDEPRFAALLARQSQ